MLIVVPYILSIVVPTYTLSSNDEESFRTQSSFLENIKKQVFSIGKDACRSKDFSPLPLQGLHNHQREIDKEKEPNCIGFSELNKENNVSDS